MCARFNDFTTVEYKNPFCHMYCRKSVCNNNSRTSHNKPLKGFLNKLLGGGRSEPAKPAKPATSP